MTQLENFGILAIISAVFIQSYCSAVDSDFVEHVFEPEKMLKIDQFVIDEDNKSYISMNGYEEDSHTSLLN